MLFGICYFQNMKLLFCIKNGACMTPKNEVFAFEFVSQRVGREGGPKKGKIAKKEESILSSSSYNNGA
jgi:hypothetical protein